MARDLLHLDSVGDGGEPLVASCGQFTNYFADKIDLMLSDLDSIMELRTWMSKLYCSMWYLSDCPAHIRTESFGERDLLHASSTLVPTGW